MRETTASGPSTWNESRPMPTKPEKLGGTADRNAYARERYARTPWAGWYSTAWWKKTRRWYLGQYPMCCDCLKERKYVLATELDHIIPHRGNEALFRDVSNLAGRCKKHHSSKTAKGG